MPTGKLLIGNDTCLYLAGLRDKRTFQFNLTATVTGNILDGPEGSVITGGGPVSMTLINIAGESLGGEAAGPTTVLSADGFDITIQVGSTVALALTAGTLIHVFHDDFVWMVREDAAAIADAQVTVHVEPFIWLANRPKKVKLVDGERIEIFDGTYLGILDAAFEVEAGETYFAQIEANDAGLQGRFNMELEAENRGL